MLNPWVAIGCFFCWLSLQDRALLGDLTYVLPATSLGYVLWCCMLPDLCCTSMCFSPLRWLGIALITGGVGFVAGGPELTHHPHTTAPADETCAVAAAVEAPPFDAAQGKLSQKTREMGHPGRRRGKL